jgi:uncharacterized RDD family membrane protein YckC
VDKLIIDTPEQVHLEFVLAGIGSRFMAALLDTLIQVGIGILASLVAVVFAATPLTSGSPTWVLAILVFVSFLILWGYYAIFETLWKGQTPGKRWAGIRVIKESGRPINAYEAIARNFVRFVDYLPAFYGVGVITMLLNHKNRRLGDLVAGTLVVHETSDREVAPSFNSSSATSDFIYPQAANLTLQEADLIEAFLVRRLDMSSAIRRENAERIAAMLSNRLAISPEMRPADTESFLELVVTEFRNRAKYR